MILTYSESASRICHGEVIFLEAKQCEGFFIYEGGSCRSGRPTGEKQVIVLLGVPNLLDSLLTLAIYSLFHVLIFKIFFIISETLYFVVVSG
jgi:hypothetical protein